MQVGAHEDAGTPLLVVQVENAVPRTVQVNPSRLICATTLFGRYLTDHRRQTNHARARRPRYTLMSSNTR